MDYREIVSLSVPDHRGRIFGIVVHELNGDFGRFLDNVVVGQDVAVAVHHDAGAEAAAALIIRLAELHPAAALTALAAKEALEEVLHAAAVIVVVIILLLSAAGLHPGCGAADLGFDAGMYSAEMFTTEGSSSFASLVKSFCSITGFGMVSGVASGAATCSFAAFAPVCASVPIRIPIDSVKIISVKDRNFCLRTLS